MYKSLVKQLWENRMMRNNIEIERFQESLDKLGDMKDPSLISHLYDVLDDKTEHEEVMWGLLHLLESFDDVFGAHMVLQSMVSVIPSLTIRAPEWTKIIHKRILNHESSLSKYKKVLSGCKPELKSVITNLLLDIKAKNEKRFGNSVDYLLTK